MPKKKIIIKEGCVIKKLIIFIFLLLVQVFSLNQIFCSSASAEERLVTIKEKRDASLAVLSDTKYHSKIAVLNKFFEVFPEKNIDEAMRKKANEQIAMSKRPKGGEPYQDPITGMEFIFVKGGCFQMGDIFGDGYIEEKPVHEVCVDDLYMGKYEVTQTQWRTIMGTNPSYFKGCDNCPVEKVSWDDVQEYINKLNQKLANAAIKKGTGKKYRLPTEAEWEYAARSGGKSERYAGSNDIDSVAWYISNFGGKTHPVGQKAPNGLGIYDMAGNVWEWVQDWYDENYYKNSPKNNPKGASSGQYRVLRGGSWGNGPLHLWASLRNRNDPAEPDITYGLRLAMSVQ